MKDQYYTLLKLKNELVKYAESSEDWYGLEQVYEEDFEGDRSKLSKQAIAIMSIV